MVLEALPRHLTDFRQDRLYRLLAWLFQSNFVGRSYR